MLQWDFIKTGVYPSSTRFRCDRKLEQVLKLHFNESKFVKLSINVTSNHLTTKYTIGSTVICEKPCHKDLGITISTDLSWTNHYNRISKAAYKTLNLLQRSISKEAPISTKKLLYLSLVRSRLLCCSPVWRPNLVKDFTQLERIQRRASKFILNYSTHDYKSRLIHLKLLPLTMTLELNDILFFIKSMKSVTTSILNRFSLLIAAPPDPLATSN